MGDTSNQIERHIQETRNDLGDNFNELQEKVRTAVDWRAQFEERPMTMMALAFGGGILLSALLPSQRTSSRRTSASRRDTSSERHRSDLSPKLPNEYNDNAASPLRAWDAVKGALVGVATTKLSRFIEDVLPGFAREFTRAQGGEDPDRSDPLKPTRQKSTAAGAD